MVATHTTARLAEIPLPDFGMPDAEPLLPPTIFAERLARLRAAMATRGYDHLVVWADREHSANLAYLSGFDPRFEEAVLVVGASGDPAVLVGNECHGMAAAAPLPMRLVTFQDLSLPGQPRDASASLPAILARRGHRRRQPGRGRRVEDLCRPRDTIEVPAFLVDALRRATPGGLVENATDLLIDPADGLRVVNEVDQLAAFEWAACQTSEGVRRVLTGLQPGMTERELCAPAGLERRAAVVPPDAHGRAARQPRAAQPRRPAHRAGRSRSRSPSGSGGRSTAAPASSWRTRRAAATATDDYVERLVAPYFEAVAEWYGALHVGQVGGELQRIADRHLGDPFFGVHLNPGHQLHLDEWVNSPVFPGSTVELRSGMALQCDIIPATGTPYFTTNIEDGVALADESLRAQLAAAYPGAWERIQARRRFMADALGIDLHADVLPLSNLAGHLRPFLLCPDRAMTLAA